MLAAAVVWAGLRKWVGGYRGPLSYEEEDTCMSYEEADTGVLCQPTRRAMRLHERIIVATPLYGTRACYTLAVPCLSD